MNTNTGANTKYGIGMKVKLTQATLGTKYGVVTATATSTITVTFNSGNQLDNEAISNPYYSATATPFGAGLIQAAQLDLTTLTRATAQTNTGTAGGTYNYMKIGTVVIAWGRTANFSSTSAADARTQIFASGIFSSPTVSFTGNSFFGGTNWEYAMFNVGDPTGLTASNTTLTITQTTTTGGAVQGACSWIVMGIG